MAVDPEGSVWIYTGTGNSYAVWSVDNRAPSFVRSVSLQRLLSPRKPVFGLGGLVGLTGGAGPLHGTRYWVDSAGVVVREDALPVHRPGESLGARRFTFPGRSGTNWIQVQGPFPIRDLLADAPTGAYARCVTRRYDIDLHDARGVRFHTIARDMTGPRVTGAERVREEAALDSLRARYRPGDYPRFPVPDRKPPVKLLWYDEDGRLWVQLWEEGGASDAVAHVYDGTGVFLFEALWPVGVSLRHGAIRGDVALGLAAGTLGVPEIVRMTFRAEPRARRERPRRCLPT